MKAKLPLSRLATIESLQIDQIVYLPIHTGDINNHQVVTESRVIEVEHLNDRCVVRIQPVKHLSIDGTLLPDPDRRSHRASECYLTLAEAFVALVERNERQGERLNQEALEFDRRAHTTRVARARILRDANLLRGQAALNSRELASA